MNSLIPDVQGATKQQVAGSLPPLCCAGGPPAPASWETHLRPVSRLHLSNHLARRTSYFSVAYTIAAVAVGSNMLTPLYSIYRQKFDFSALTLTLIFATYVITIIPAMLIFGPLADAFGRRRIMLISVLTAALGAILLLTASSTPWLFAVRIMQGVAQGAIGGVGSAAMIELGSDIKKSALVNAVAISGGLALGPILTGILAQYAPLPLMLPFFVLLVLLIPALIGTLLMVEPLAVAERRAFRPHRPALPTREKRAFLISTAIIAFSFGIMALFLSVLPSFLAALLHTKNIALLIAPIGLFLGVTPLVQLLLHNLSARRSAIIGLLLEVIGLIGTLYTASIGSLPLLLASAVVGGCGSGLAFLGALSLINRIVPKEERGDAFGTFYALGYLCLGISSITVGLCAGSLGLSTAVRWVATVVIILCLLTTLGIARLIHVQD